MYIYQAGFDLGIDITDTSIWVQLILNGESKLHIILHEWIELNQVDVAMHTPVLCYLGLQIWARVEILPGLESFLEIVGMQKPIA